MYKMISYCNRRNAGAVIATIYNYGRNNVGLFPLISHCIVSCFVSNLRKNDEAFLDHSIISCNGVVK